MPYQSKRLLLLKLLLLLQLRKRYINEDSDISSDEDISG